MNTKQFEQFEQNYKVFSGYLSADPEIKYFESGSCKTSFSLPLKKKKDDDATWLNCECWGKIAENIAEHYKKSDEITVFGYFTEQEYNKKTYLKFIVKVVG